MYPIKKITTLFILFSFGAFSQHKSNSNDIDFYQIKTDSLFNSKQIISVIQLKKSKSNVYKLQITPSKDSLNKTSEISIENNAVAAINGGFFNVKKGGSVTYLEKNNIVYGVTTASDTKKSDLSYFLNAALIFTKKDKLYFEFAKTDSIYKKSKKESAVLVAGPLLLQNKKIIPLFESNFSKNRHPRTLLCTNNKYSYLITIDGRSDTAYGMSLFEAQQFLINFGCSDAINLDGGGSTTMLMNHKIVNNPSDKTGERPVANAILVIKK